MTFDEFKASLSAAPPPAGLGAALEALGHDARGDWHAAHERVQSDGGEAAAWVHAYLHRKEGDLSNANYWYRRAGRSPSSDPLDEEWEAIARELLE